MMLVSLTSQAQKYLSQGRRLKIAQNLAKVDDSTAAKIVGVSTETYRKLVNNQTSLPSYDAMEAAIYALQRKRKGTNTF